MVTYIYKKFGISKNPFIPVRYVVLMLPRRTDTVYTVTRRNAEFHSTARMYLD